MQPAKTDKRKMQDAAELLIFSSIGALCVICTVDGIFGTTFLAQALATLRPHTWNFALGITLGLAHDYVSSAVWFVAARFFPPAPPYDFNMPRRLGALSLACALRAACEEIVYRAVMQTILGLVPAMVAFAAAHYYTRRAWSDVFMTSLSAIGYGLVYYYTGSLWVCITMHATFNLLCFAHNIAYENAMAGESSASITGSSGPHTDNYQE